MASRAVASAWASCVVASLGLSGAATYFMGFLELFDNVLGLYSPMECKKMRQRRQPLQL